MDIKILLETQFTKQKLNKDFYSWISGEFTNLDKIEIKELSTEKRKTISINKNELLTPFKYIVEYDKFLGVYYKIYIAIGKFRKTDLHGFMEIEKGIVKLYYNADLSWYDGDLFYDLMHEKPNSG